MAKAKQCESEPVAQISGVGPKRARIMIVGDAPNYTEVKTNSYGQGNSHKLLTNLLNDAGIKISDCYYTPVIKQPKDDKGKISAQVMKEHKVILDREIAEVSPEWIIPLGANALKALTRTTKITEVHGTVIPHKAGYKLFPALHPAMSLRDPRHWEAIQFDFKMFGKEWSGKGKVKHELDFKWVKTPIHLWRIIKRAKAGESYSYDLETNGLQMRLDTSKMSLSIVAFKDMVYVIDHEQIDHELIGKMWRRLSELPIKDGQEISTANGKFDQLWLYYTFGVKMHNTFDVNLASHLLDENSPNGLKHNARVALEIDNWEVDTDTKKGIIEPTKKRITELRKKLTHLKGAEKMKALAKLIAKERKLNKARQVEYAAWDGYATLRLQKLRLKQLSADSALLNLFRWETMPASNAYFIAETNGVCLDQEALQKAEQRLKLKIRQCLRKLNRHTDEQDVNWNSPDQLNRILFEELELKAEGFTDGGVPSTAEDYLIKMKPQHPIIEALLEYRGYFKQLSGFIDGWQRMQIHGRIFPNFKIAGTVTGRPSCSEPNLQQVPRDPFIRSIITAPPGYVFFECDYSQAELRIAAAVSGEPTMLSTYRNGGDIHVSTYISVMGMSPEEAVAHIIDPGKRKAQLKEERKKAKAVNFGFIYGMGWKKFREYAETTYGLVLTVKEAQMMRKRYFEVYAGLIAWHDRQRKIVKAVKQVRTLSGRIRHLPQIDSPDDSLAHQAERLAINSPIQGFGAELGLMAISEIDAYFNNDIVKLVGTIHDAIVGYVKIGHELAALRRIQMIMESPKVMRKMGIDFPLPIVADVSIGNWGIGHEMKDDFRNIKPIVIKDGVVKPHREYMVHHEPGARYGRCHSPKSWKGAAVRLKDEDAHWRFVTKEEYHVSRKV